MEMTTSGVTGAATPRPLVRRYALITPARNEAALIEQTIKSVVAQTVQPVRWVIVSDGSTDGTDQIVAAYASNHGWLELVRMPEHRDRHFAAKVACFNAGYERLRTLEYDLVGNLDADITFDPRYFEFLLEKFALDPRLGVAGTPFTEENVSYDFRFASLNHVSGACQLFRKECFEAIGGYVPVKGGGIDLIAVLTARMKGWNARTFPEKTCLHHRKIGTAKHGPIRAKYLDGRKDYMLGGHPIWELFRVCYQLRNRPYLIGGLAMMGGYLWAMSTRVERPVSQELLAFRRQDQMVRLRAILRRWLRLGSAKQG